MIENIYSIPDKPTEQDLLDNREAKSSILMTLIWRFMNTHTNNEIIAAIDKFRGLRENRENPVIGTFGEVKPDGTAELILNEKGRALFGPYTTVIVKAK